MIVIETILFAAVYYAEDLKSGHLSMHSKVNQFSQCLVANRSDKTKCLEDAKGLVLSKTTVVAGMFGTAVRLPAFRALSGLILIALIAY
jgi:hypothetical protein